MARDPKTVMVVHGETYMDVDFRLDKLDFKNYAGVGFDDLTFTQDPTDDNGNSLNGVRISWGDGSSWIFISGDMTAKQMQSVSFAFWGTNGPEHLAGNSGSDEVTANGGNDVVRGEAGKDTLKGGHGDDRLYGGNGSDILQGGDGDDTLYGSDGRDKLYGGIDDDTLYGGRNSDLLYGGAGHDELHGGYRDDTVYGEVGNDEIYGGVHNDKLYGGEGDDKIFGGSGDDKLYDGAGNDVLTGGRGRDLFVIDMATSHGRDVIKDFNADKDKLEITNARGRVQNVEDVDGNVEITYHVGQGEQRKVYKIVVQNATMAEIKGSVTMDGITDQEMDDFGM